MVQPIAQAADAAQGIPVSYVLTALGVLSAGAVAVVGFLWKSFLESQRKAEAQRKSDAEQFAELKRDLKETRGKVEIMGSVIVSNSNFVSAIIGMSMNGDTIKSDKVHDLYHHFKPADGTGAHRPLKL